MTFVREYRFCKVRQYVINIREILLFHIKNAYLQFSL